jgi:pimeloyl-ACP methyl ester carboxylesterase
MHVAPTSVHIATDDMGTGEPALVFMPGWCANRTMFRDLLPLAAERRRAAALDWRGHGESGRADGDYGNDDLVADAISAVESAGIDRFVPVAVAHSGWVAIELRRRLGPGRVPGLVLCDWMVLGPPPPFLVALAGLQDPDLWQDVRATLFSMWTEGTDLPALDALIAEMGGYGFDTWSRAGREIAACFATERSPVQALEDLKPASPTLHIYAQPRDDGFLEAQRQYAAAHPWFEVRRLDARSHFPMFEVPGNIVATIEAFLKRLDRSLTPSTAHSGIST